MSPPYLTLLLILPPLLPPPHAFTAAIVLPHALPVIQQKLQAPASTATTSPSPTQPPPPHPPQYIPGPEDGVWQRESGMLALGALSTGCLIEMGQYLPQLFPFLVQV